MLSRDLQSLESEFGDRLGETLELTPEGIAVLHALFRDMRERAEALERLTVPAAARGPVIGPRLVVSNDGAPRACTEPPWGWGGPKP